MNAMNAMTNNILKSTSIISNPLNMIARHLNLFRENNYCINTKFVFFLIDANIMQKHWVEIYGEECLGLSNGYILREMRSAMLIDW